MIPFLVWMANMLIKRHKLQSTMKKVCSQLTTHLLEWHSSRNLCLLMSDSVTISDCVLVGQYIRVVSVRKIDSRPFVQVWSWSECLFKHVTTQTEPKYHPILYRVKQTCENHPLLHEVLLWTLKVVSKRAWNLQRALTWACENKVRPLISWSKAANESPRALATYGDFQSWGYPQNGWFIREIPIKIDYLRVPPF